MKILLLSPYHGGSHRSWAEGYRRHSRHKVEILSLAARYWKWRMHGAALTLSRRLKKPFRFDCLLATDMLDLGLFLGRTRRELAHLPAFLYMHENQLTYPLPDDPSQGPMRRQRGERDHHYAFTNFASMQVADRIFFNSSYHREAWFDALPRFLKNFPEERELASVRRLRRRSQVLPVGITAPPVPPEPSEKASPPLVIWNQRWEYDKQPELFFETICWAADQGFDFRLAICGRRFSKQPAVFEEALSRLGPRIVHVGYAAPAAYRRLLSKASLTLSTAEHEFFGVSILEAALHGVFPILPFRLSYPEIIPSEFHASCLYRSVEGMRRRLTQALSSPEEATRKASLLARRLEHFRWPQVAALYDQTMEKECRRVLAPSSLSKEQAT